MRWGDVVGGDGAGEGDDAPLAGGVGVGGEVPLAADETEDGGEIDDRAATAGQHRRDGELAAEEDARQVGVDDGVPPLLGALGDRAVAEAATADPGGVEHRVEPPPAVDRHPDGGLKLGGHGHVGAAEHGIAAGVGAGHRYSRGFLPAVRGAAEQHHPGPSAANRIAAARPMPLPAPVMIATLPARRPVGDATSDVVSDAPDDRRTGWIAPEC